MVMREIEPPEPRPETTLDKVVTNVINILLVLIEKFAFEC